MPEAVRPAIAAATGGDVTGLRGGLPIRIDGTLLGGIGVGAGSGAQDGAVPRAAVPPIRTPACSEGPSPRSGRKRHGDKGSAEAPPLADG